MEDERTQGVPDESGSGPEPADEQSRRADEAESKRDEVLDSIIGPDDSSEKQEPEKEPEPESGSAGSGGGSEVDRDALTRAIGALRRDNVPQSVIEAYLNEDPSVLIAWGESALRRQSDIDTKLRGRSPKPSEPKAKDTDEDASEADPTGTPATDSRIEELVRPFAEELGSEYAQKTLTDLARHIRTTTLSEVQPVLDEYRQALQSLASMVEEAELRSARASLRERFPQVAEDKSWQAVLEKARILSASGGYKDVPTVVEDAARILYGEFRLREQQKSVAKSHAMRANGTPTVPTRSVRSSKPTPDEIREALLDSILGRE